MQISALLRREPGVVRVPITPDEVGGLPEILNESGELRTLPSHLPGSRAAAFWPRRFLRRPPIAPRLINPIGILTIIQRPGLRTPGNGGRAPWINEFAGRIALFLRLPPDKLEEPSPWPARHSRTGCASRVSLPPAPGWLCGAALARPCVPRSDWTAASRAAFDRAARYKNQRSDSRGGHLFRLFCFRRQNRQRAWPLAVRTRAGSAAWARALAGFGWLRHLRAADTAVARANARALVDDFLTWQAAQANSGMGARSRGAAHARLSVAIAGDSRWRRPRLLSPFHERPRPHPGFSGTQTRRRARRRTAPPCRDRARRIRTLRGRHRQSDPQMHENCWPRNSTVKFFPTAATSAAIRRSCSICCRTCFPCGRPMRRAGCSLRRNSSTPSIA